MSIDKRTIEIYDQRAGDYAKVTKDLDGIDELKTFIQSMPDGARVLDLGCGPGLYAQAMANAGIRVDATDASIEMVRLAAQYDGVNAFQATFDDITGDAAYHGIWASFSLLHATREKFPRHLAALYRALKPGGLFYLAMKLGDGQARDTIDRFYTYYTRDELLTYLTDAGFKIDTTSQGRGPGLDGVDADWIAVSAHA
jgi:2-polyprenyl-3-methyl-5-hydroxy-6-metoxy-1,4-benzoquinol methylase